MAGKTKSIYLSVVVRTTQKAVFQKKFFEAKSYNEFVKDEAFRAKYPEPEFQYIKEIY